MYGNTKFMEYKIQTTKKKGPLTCLYNLKVMAVCPFGIGFGNVIDHLQRVAQ